jgi:hypothetical protein
MSMYLSEIHKLNLKNGFMMDYRFLAGRKKAFWRYGSILLTSLLLKILIDLSFGLTYSNYQFSFNLLELAWIIFLMYFLLEGIRFINRYSAESGFDIPNRIYVFGKENVVDIAIEGWHDQGW